MVKLEILGTYYSHIGDFRYKIMRSLNANILFVVKCFKKAVMGSIIYIFNIWGRMTKYQSRIERERERESSSLLCVLLLMSAQGKEIFQNMGKERERLPIHEPTSQYSLMMGGGGGGGGVVCPLSSAGHRSHCLDTVQSPMG